jgi:hypothetical protein
VDTNLIATKLKKSFPEIASVDFNIPVFSQTASVKLDIPPPSFFLESQGVKYVLSSSGVAIAEAPSLEKIKDLPVLEDQTGFTVRIGQTVLPASQVQFINSVITQSHSAGIPISTLILPAKAMELDLRAQDQPYYVKFYIGGDPLLETGQYIAARHQFQASHTQPAEYLDVRVPGKIYYR